MAREDVERIITDYGFLIDRALAVKAVPGVGPAACVDARDLPSLSLRGEDPGGVAVLSWRRVETDYYGGGHCETEATTFPAHLLWLSGEDFNRFVEQARHDHADRDARVAAALATVERDRREAHDRAEWARLRAKYGDGAMIRHLTE
jgi:hypothetical protein